MAATCSWAIFYPTTHRESRITARQVWTFKQDYAEIFTTSALYEVVDRVVGNHSGAPGPEASQDRMAHTLLRRSTVDLYQVDASGAVR
jgi:hypothetical protein